LPEAERDKKQDYAPAVEEFAAGVLFARQEHGNRFECGRVYGMV